jgi:hypothetical protein
VQIALSKKSIFESGLKSLSAILVELPIKFVESRYWAKSKKKVFTSLKLSTNFSGLRPTAKAPTFAGIESIQLSNVLISV